MKSESDVWQENEIAAFQNAVIRWFKEEGNHDLPWRQTSDPYPVLVSELMLQQTQVATVLKRGFFENWMEQFPTVEILARAEEAEILKAWEGLGYYNRARNLQKAAQVIVEKHGGEFPDQLEAILELPGVGRYTAGAVFSCAFEKSAPVVDGNVFRVFSRLFAYLEPVDTSTGQKQMWKWAEELVPDEDAKLYNSGLMEIGQKVCRKSSPYCDSCPVSVHCRGRKDHLDLNLLPVKKNRVKIVEKTERVALLEKDGRVFLTQERGKRRNGLWRLPLIEESKTKKLVEILRFKYGITKFRVQLLVFQTEDPEVLAPEEAGQWFTPSQLEGIAMAAPYRKALDSVKDTELF